MTAPTVCQAAERLIETVRYAVGTELLHVDDRVLLEPDRLRHTVEAALAGNAGRVRVTGTLDRRMVCIERQDGKWVVADLSGRPHRTRAWPAWALGHLKIANADSWLSIATLDEHAVYRLSRPIVLLATLYHPGHVPLPRFPLGVSDAARAARTSLLGTVRLADMRLDVTLRDLIQQVRTEVPDILGISAAFGQHDLMAALLDAVYDLAHPPLIVAGGSLTVRNEALLLERYPRLLIARGGEEATVEALLAHWHGDLELGQVPGLGFN